MVLVKWWSSEIGKVTRSERGREINGRSRHSSKTLQSYREEPFMGGIAPSYQRAHHLTTQRRLAIMIWRCCWLNLKRLSWGASDDRKRSGVLTDAFIFSIWKRWSSSTTVKVHYRLSPYDWNQSFKWRLEQGPWGGTKTLIKIKEFRLRECGPTIVHWGYSLCPVVLWDVHWCVVSRLDRRISLDPGRDCVSGHKLVDGPREPRQEFHNIVSMS